MIERILKASDFHVPFHDKRTIGIALKFIKHIKPEILIIDELMDFYSISKFSKDPHRKLHLQKDLDIAKKILVDIRNTVPDARIIMLESNHAKRLVKFLRSKAEELSDLRCMKLKELLELDSFNIEYKKTFTFRKVLFKHGNIVRQHSAYTAKAEMDKEGTSGASGHCFSEDTEVLSSAGWKNFKDLSIGEEVMTYNMENDSSEWNKVKDVFSYDDYTEMVHFKNTVVDLMVTKKHNVVYSNRYDCFNLDFKKTPASNLIGKRIDIPCGGINTQEDAPYEDDFLRLCAWVITEGNYGFKKNSKSCSIRIAQSDKEKVGVKHITDICDKIGQNYSAIKRYDAGSTEHGQHRNHDSYRINLNVSDITREIVKLFPDKQLITPLLKLSSRQFRLMFYELILADGNKNKDAKRSYQYSSKNESEIDILQGMCSINGFRSSKIKRKRNDSEYFVLTINTRGVSSISKGGKVVPYKGKVWCATVDNGTLMVRRNGKTIVCGNTHRLGMYFRTLRGGEYVWIEGGCLCSRNCGDEYVEGTANWQQGLSMFTFKKGKRRFHPELIPIIDREILWGGKSFK